MRRNENGLMKPQEKSTSYNHFPSRIPENVRLMHQNLWSTHLLLQEWAEVNIFFRQYICEISKIQCLSYILIYWERKDICTLNHEIFDDAMELRSFETISLLTGRQSSEVLGRFWYLFAEQTNNYTTRLKFNAFKKRSEDTENKE